MDMEQPVTPISQPFGLIIPGKNVITNFIPDATGTKFTLDIPFPSPTSSSMDDSSFPSHTQSQNERDMSPTSVSDLVFFLLPNIPLPPNTGAMLYWSASAMNNDGNSIMSGSNSNITSSGFELLGALTPTKTSAVFRTGWSSHDQLLHIIEQQRQQPSQSAGIKITLGVSIESLDNISNLQILERGVEDRKNVAKKIATDLFNYLQSFDGVGSATNGLMTVPSNVFERWFKRFEGKLSRDPNFFMKNSVE